MKLYYNPLSTYSQKTLIALYEKQVAFEPALVNLNTPEGQAEYAKVYAIGKVPLLQLDDDYHIPESTIIIEYLEGHYQTGTRLIPDGVDPARQVRFMDRMSDLYLIDPSATLLFEKFGFSKHTEAQLAKASKYLHILFERFDKKLASQDWLCGEFSMADCAAIPPLFYCQYIAPFSDYKNIVRYYERAKQRPSYAKVMAEFLPIWEGVMSKAAAK
ncbi:MAG: glutathione S-transferase family protein [Pseudomonadota bacterium]